MTATAQSWNACAEADCRGLCEREDGSVEFFDGDLAFCPNCAAGYLVVCDGSGPELVELDDPEYQARRRAKVAEAETKDARAALAALLDATTVYALYHGQAADHHRDDCPENGGCADCLIDDNTNAAIEAAERVLGRRP